MKKFLALILIIYTSPLLAYQSEAEFLLQTSEKCTRYFPYFEEKYKLPPKLLQSVSLIESGRWHQQLKKSLPWPWAVNQAGKSYYFDTKNEAIKAVTNMLASGITNIDIGCMQVNLNAHPKAFKSLFHAFEPRYNIEFGAELLSNHYAKFADWKKAIAAYHSMSDLGKIYYSKVANRWSKEVLSAMVSNTTTTQFARKKILHHTPRLNPKRLKSKMVIE